MKNKKAKRFGYLINLIIPAVLFGSITGVFTSLVVLLFKVLSGKVIHLSESIYHYIGENLLLIPAVIIFLGGVSYVFTVVYKKTPNLSGGGIPTSIGVLRGLVKFEWAKNLFGVFILSLVSFFIGVPLGTEGPSVQMGTAVGMGSITGFSKKHKAWERYTMTGGACAGFSVATGSPISGILFSIEEAHQRISPMILIVSATSVMFSFITTEILSPILNVSASLFPTLSLIKLTFKDSWIPLVVGLVMGIFAVLFLNYYNAINSFFNKKLKKIPHYVKILFIFIVTLLFGLASYDYISTGHELILALFEHKLSLLFLFSLLIFRSTLTLGANTNRITGGVFIPILAIGAVLSAIIAQLLEKVSDINEEYYVIILVLGISACISGMMKMPLTSIAFSVEALSGHENILYFIIASVTAFIVTEIFDAKSINDRVLDNKIEEQNREKTAKVIDTYVIVQEDSFAVGKQIRDIFWPANLFVLSIKHTESSNAEIDEHGGKAIRVNDILHVRYSTYDEELTRNELTAIVGEQSFSAEEIVNV